jgi:polyisoprenoid-binding protein YceI
MVIIFCYDYKIIIFVYYMKNILIIFAVCIVGFGAVGYLYLTRAPELPSQSVNIPIGDMSGVQMSEGESYTISTESLVRFEIDEILRDQPFTAVGTTTEIGGVIGYEDDMLVLGTIRINARTFKTDSERRDGAIANLILRSDQADNEFIVFVPTGIVKTGEMTYSVTGDMTISGKTNSETFNVVLSMVTDTEITGTAEGTLSRNTYGLTIPDVPFVASVEDEFLIKADIVAIK